MADITSSYRPAGSDAPASGAAQWLCLAATPTFAAMVLLTSVLSHDAPNVLCSATQHASGLSEMAPMYLLMSVFHAAPWLRLIGNVCRRVTRA